MDVAVVLAAGDSTRFGGPVSKVFQPLDGQPLLVRAVHPYRAIGGDMTTVVAVRLEDRRAALRLLPRARIVNGGRTRQESLQRAMRFLPPSIRVVLIQDAARPLTPLALVRRVLHAARRDGAAAPITLPADPLHHVAPREGRVTPLLVDTVDDRGLGLAQSPIGVQAHILRAALLVAERNGFEAPDDVSLLMRAGIPVTAVAGETYHPKIIRPSDLQTAETWLRGSRRS